MPGRTECPFAKAAGLAPPIGGYFLPNLHWIGYRQFGTAAIAATGKYLAAVLGGHAGAEAMNFGTLTLFRLISSY